MCDYDPNLALLPTPVQKPSDILSSYASYLKGIYRSRSQNHTSKKWANIQHYEYIQLAMIRGEEIRRGEPEEEMIRLAQQGNNYRDYHETERTSRFG